MFLTYGPIESIYVPSYFWMMTSLIQGKLQFLATWVSRDYVVTLSGTFNRIEVTVAYMRPQKRKYSSFQILGVIGS